MSAIKWNYLNAKSVYIYPSANADDGGDVNSEYNVSGIVNHLIQKNFVVRKNKDEEPLKVEYTESQSKPAICINPGGAVLDGYYLDLSPLKDQRYVVEKAFVALTNPEEYLNKYKVIYQKWYNPDGTKKKFKRGDEPKEELPLIHLIVKLLKDVTGNLRGDLLQRNSSGTRTLICKGVAWSFVTDEELSELDIPYLELAKIRVDGYSSAAGNFVFTPDSVINSSDKYSYIDINSVFTEEDGKTLDEVINDRLSQTLKDLDSISHIKPEDESNPEGPLYKDVELSLSDGTVKVNRYVPKEPREYDDEGNVVTILDTNFDKSYSIDEIQKRTHVASSDESTSQDTIARAVDSNDNGQGKISGVGTVGTIKSFNNNGSSKLLARADHDHDNRYIRSKTGGSEDTPQEIDTPINISKSLSSKDLSVGSLKKFNVDSDGHIHNDIIETSESSVKLNKDTTVRGVVRADQVFNAVWNDYAELYLKDNEDDIIEPGTVICKVPGSPTYTSSDYTKRKLVVGVCSDSYGHLVGGDADKTLEENLKKYIPVALAGRFYVKVAPRCTIEEGDLLKVSAFRGCVTSNDFPDQGAIVGKALESTDGSKEKILMQVMLG